VDAGGVQRRGCRTNGPDHYIGFLGQSQGLLRQFVLSSISLSLAVRTTTLGNIN
jgi:hypothetical protein